MAFGDGFKGKPTGEHAKDRAEGMKAWAGTGLEWGWVNWGLVGLWLKGFAGALMVSIHRILVCAWVTGSFSSG